MTDQDAVNAAVRHLVEDPNEDRDDIIALAGADDEPPEVIDSLIDRLAGPTSDGEPLNTVLLREAEAHGDELLDPTEEEPLLRRWLWAHLSELVSVHGPEDIRSRPDELWAHLGRPEELRPMSAWSVPEPGQAHDPYATVIEMMHVLDAEMDAIGRRRRGERRGSQASATMNAFSASAASFTEVLVGRFPYLDPLLREHLQDLGELLPHLFFGDLTRYIVAAFRATDVRGSTESHLSGLLDELEQAISGDDEAISELVAVSFVENLPGPDEAADDLHRLLGPELRAQYERIWQQP